MKKRSILYVVLGILVSCLAGCVNEQEDGSTLEDRELEQFFSYRSKGETREGVPDLPERGVLCVINTLCNWDEILPFIRMFKTDYGQPLWDHSVFVTCKDRYVLYVPVVNKTVDSEIETIWTFYIKGDTLYHFPLVRACDAQYVEEYWKFDYFTTYALGKEPASGLKFYHSPRWTTPPAPELNCTHAYVVIGGVSYDKGIHCWWDEGSGGDYTPGPEFPPQPILPGEAPGGGGSGGAGPVYDPVINKIASAATLTETQFEKLREAIEVMEDICMVDALMGEMKSQGKTISIVNIDSQLSAKGAEASYKPNSNTLSFASEDNITPQALLHEYFHFYQTKKNKDIVAGKNGVMEIERNIYYDIVFTCMYYQSNKTDYGVWTYQPDATLNNCMTGENYNKYQDWLESIYNTLKNGGTVTITRKDLEDWGNLYKENTANSVYKTYDYSAANYVIAINDALKLNLSNNCIK